MSKLVDKFIVPPFSILDTKQQYWQNRKRDWICLGIKSELGRDAECNVKTMSGLSEEEYLKRYGKKAMQGTSIFDPVLCEIMYKWFCPKKGKILDPFAGGSVRGIVACKGEFEYTGIDLSEKQIESNFIQAKEIGLTPLWLVGDSDTVLDTINEKYDFIFSCPPYHDLEVYSDLTEDLSNMTYEEFLIKYQNIIKKSLDKLKDNSFAVFVVSNIRDKKGFYKNLVSDTIKAFNINGAKFYNDIILYNAIGTLPLRVAAHFKKGRKVGKAHQNVLVFFKGDPEKIVERLGIIELECKEQKSVWDYNQTQNKTIEIKSNIETEELVEETEEMVVEIKESKTKSLFDY